MTSFRAVLCISGGDSIDSMDWLDDDGSWAIHHVMEFSLAIVVSPYFTCCNAFACILRSARKWSIWDCLILTYLYSRSDSSTLEMMYNAWSSLLCVSDTDHDKESSLLREFLDGLHGTNCFLYKSQWSRLRSTCMSTWETEILGFSNHFMVHCVKYSAMIIKRTIIDYKRTSLN